MSHCVSMHIVIIISNTVIMNVDISEHRSVQMFGSENQVWNLNLSIKSYSIL